MSIPGQTDAVEAASPGTIVVAMQWANVFLAIVLALSILGGCIYAGVAGWRMTRKILSPADEPRRSDREDAT